MLPSAGVRTCTFVQSAQCKLSAHRVSKASTTTSQQVASREVATLATAVQSAPQATRASKAPWSRRRAAEEATPTPPVFTCAHCAQAASTRMKTAPRAARPVVRVATAPRVARRPFLARTAATLRRSASKARMAAGRAMLATTVQPEALPPRSAAPARTQLRPARPGATSARRARTRMPLARRHA